jgi:hypothetical protein
MHAGRKHLVLAHGGEGKFAFGNDGQRRAIGRVDRV